MVGAVVRDHLEQDKPEPLHEAFSEMLGQIDGEPRPSQSAETQVEKVRHLMQQYGFTQEQACGLLARFENEEKLHEAARRLQASRQVRAVTIERWSSRSWSRPGNRAR